MYTFVVANRAISELMQALMKEQCESVPRKRRCLQSPVSAPVHASLVPSHNRPIRPGIRGADNVPPSNTFHQLSRPYVNAVPLLPSPPVTMSNHDCPVATQTQSGSVYESAPWVSPEDVYSMATERQMSIIRGLDPQTRFMKAATRMSHWIDPRCPRTLAASQKSFIQEDPEYQKAKRKVEIARQTFHGPITHHTGTSTVCCLREALFHNGTSTSDKNATYRKYYHRHLRIGCSEY